MSLLKLINKAFFFFKADFGVAILFDPPKQLAEAEEEKKEANQPKRQLTKKPTMQI